MTAPSAMIAKTTPATVVIRTIFVVTISFQSQLVRIPRWDPEFPGSHEIACKQQTKSTDCLSIRRNTIEEVVAAQSLRRMSDCEKANELVRLQEKPITFD